MHTSLLRRTIDPIIAATAATLMCAVAANSQIVVSQENSENPSLISKLRASERFVPDVIMYETAPAKRPAVDTAVINKLIHAKKATSTPKSFAQVPGHEVQ